MITLLYSALTLLIITLVLTITLIMMEIKEKLDRRNKGDK